MAELVADLDSELERARAGGGRAAIDRHKKRGKLLARERIERLVDPGGGVPRALPLAAHGLYDGEAPGAGIVTGVGPVPGAAVRDRGQRRHGEGRKLLPADGEEAPARAGGGAGRTGCRASTWSTPAAPSCRCRPRCSPIATTSAGSSTTRRGMSAAGIPRSRVVMGSCTAGGAYVPAMSDETVIVHGTGTIFLGGPPLVKAATGEEVTAEELGGADVHTPAVRRRRPPRGRRRARARRSAARSSGTWTTRAAEPWVRLEPEPPALDPGELYGVVAPTSATPSRCARSSARIVDGSRFHEFKASSTATRWCAGSRT